jgi:hypothetical protein
MIFQVLGQVYLEQRPPGWFSMYQDNIPEEEALGWFFRYTSMYTWSRGLQDGFPGTGTGIHGADASRMLFQVMGKVSGPEASRLVFKVLGELLLKQRPPGWFFLLGKVYQEQRPPDWFQSTGRRIPGKEASRLVFQVLGEVNLEQRPSDWVSGGSGTGIPRAEASRLVLGQV